MPPMRDQAEIVFLTIVADAIREIDEWPLGELTTDRFMERLQELLEDSCIRDLDQLEYLESAVRSLHASLWRSVDLLRDPKAPPRATRH